MRGLSYSTFSLKREDVNLVYTGFEILLPQIINYGGYKCKAFRIKDGKVFTNLVTDSPYVFLPDSI